MMNKPAPTAKLRARRRDFIAGLTVGELVCPRKCGMMN
jgi:hypothetical protein